ncbi:hypothetical protein SAY87_007939 [Trapa incisa]|uniref:Epidermal patterning factor-like protein n=1 Tax=Trapa incisa TaxID=236973 RepID=A0AAN7KNY7_9MYRT|nr:hypothetical protein SAY87_007939 [Trapa incisa]
MGSLRYCHSSYPILAAVIVLLLSSSAISRSRSNAYPAGRDAGQQQLVHGMTGVVRGKVSGEDRLGRYRILRGLGSSPPTCRSKCGRCYPCSPVQVPVQPGLSLPLEYYPEAWRSHRDLQWSSPVQLTYPASASIDAHQGRKRGGRVCGRGSGDPFHGQCLATLLWSKMVRLVLTRGGSTPERPLCSQSATAAAELISSGGAP